MEEKNQLEQHRDATGRAHNLMLLLLLGVAAAAAAEGDASAAAESETVNGVDIMEQMANLGLHNC